MTIPMEIIPVAMMDQVLKHALVRQPEAIAWEEVIPVKKTAEDGAAFVAH